MADPMRHRQVDFIEIGDRVQIRYKSDVFFLIVTAVKFERNAVGKMMTYARVKGLPGWHANPAYCPEPGDLYERAKNYRGKEVSDVDAWKTWSYGTLKANAAREFQKMIRYESVDDDGLVRCVTCPNSAHWRNQGSAMHAGHYVSGRAVSVLFEPSNCHPQCYTCNVHRSGNQEVYSEFMIARYGVDEIQRLRKLRNTSVKIPAEELNEMRLNFRRRWQEAKRKLEEKG